MRLLLIEDDLNLAHQLQHNLEASGYIVDVSGTLSDARYMTNEISYDIIIMDLGLPDGSGLSLLTEWRQGHEHTPVLVLTARDNWEEKVITFQAGADDYVCKPFRQEELLVRLEALLRRSKPHQCPNLSAGGISLDESTQDAIILESGERISLTFTEYRLLQHFLRNPGRLYSKQKLLDTLYQFDAERESNIVESYIRRLRTKLGKQVIENRRFQGYRYKGLL
ncbi:response regulator transcription factor [Neptuniibacter sp.]|uniref:response regulator transcription factor n=1 Tax=Neptuniibacter sp. TaxID=1962643 RepID=UPI00262802A7|nr:response regulator transcription factor [Neptuniibacter sp.]MCP4596825.1 response regulator transcription factor [Neptuniibacter sp.]